ncbi:hypothetical protein HMI54_004754 [Coelomomyces lativittatus]|nr:hypothetical protein HMI55_002246 [Coelomomyces lativittatus]KAJ1506841.1 hypothetical protein HMI54_004754 [Coelomomyces lativittatus]
MWLLSTRCLPCMSVMGLLLCSLYFVHGFIADNPLFHFPVFPPQRRGSAPKPHSVSQKSQFLSDPPPSPPTSPPSFSTNHGPFPESYRDLMEDMHLPRPSGKFTSFSTFQNKAKQKLQVYFMDADLTCPALYTLLYRLHVVLAFTSPSLKEETPALVTHYEEMLQGIWVGGKQYLQTPIFREGFSEILKSMLHVKYFQGHHLDFLRCFKEAMDFMVRVEVKMNMKSYYTMIHELSRTYIVHHSHQQYGLQVHVHMFNMFLPLFNKGPKGSKSSHVVLFYKEFTKLIYFTVFKKNCKFQDDCLVIGYVLQNFFTRQRNRKKMEKKKKENENIEHPPRLPLPPPPNTLPLKKEVKKN